jgi:cytochrome P450
MISSSLLQPSAWYHQMQSESPVYFDDNFQLIFGAAGAWQVFRYEDVQRVLHDFECFSNNYKPESPDNNVGSSLNRIDPPLHRQLRSLVSKAFAPSILSSLETWMYQQCKTLLTPWLMSGEMDFVHHFAMPLSVRVIARLLGVPEPDHIIVDQWAKVIVSNPAESGGMAEYRRVQQEMVTFFTNMLEERRKLPQQDLMTHLLAAEVDGEKLSTKDVIATCKTILLAGYETTVALLTNAMYIFTQEHPELQTHLTENAADIPAALNEVLRYRPSLLSMYRMATRDVEMGGQLIKKGDLVNAWIAVANRDPAIFPDPDLFDFRRNNHAQMLSFGYGIHYCIGASLSKMETRIAFEVLFKLAKSFKIKPGTTLSLNSSVIVSSFKNLPVIFHQH